MGVMGVNCRMAGKGVLERCGVERSDGPGEG